MELNIVHAINARARSLKLSVLPSGEIKVTRPRFVPLRRAEQFVKDQHDWISQQLQRHTISKQALNIDSDQILYFGKVVHITAQFSPDLPSGVQISEAELIINPVLNAEHSIQNMLNRFLKQQGSRYILQRLQVFGQKMNIQFEKVVFREQKSRWGSCSHRGNLNFNWRLVHAPEEVIDYVIVHELAHRVHFNHSPGFWKLVERFAPEYRKHRGWLKRHGAVLASFKNDTV